MTTQLVDSVLATLEPREGTIPVLCDNFNCQRPIFVPAECLDHDRTVRSECDVDSAEGIVVGGNRHLYCSPHCWSNYEHD
ncbi:MAG: hypothetical protein Q7R33_00190 [Nitrosarchaeum sp.]|nr:hypothetical protein [Nitrosarchaeum sp.]